MLSSKFETDTIVKFVHKNTVGEVGVQAQQEKDMQEGEPPLIYTWRNCIAGHIESTNN